MVDSSILHFHKRDVLGKPFPETCVCPCLPGFSRVFCSSNGDFYPCERVNLDELHVIGNADTGIRADNCLALIEKFRDMGDCGNCVAQRYCQNCFAMIYPAESNDIDHEWTRKYFQLECQNVIESLRNILIYYTTIMETNDQILDSLVSVKAGDHSFASDGRKISIFSTTKTTMSGEPVKSP